MPVINPRYMRKGYCSRSVSSDVLPVFRNLVIQITLLPSEATMIKLELIV